MTPQIETLIRIHFKTSNQLIVDVLSERDEMTEVRFGSLDEALNEIRVLENESQIFYPF
jgi:hypothetical protein